MASFLMQKTMHHKINDSKMYKSLDKRNCDVVIWTILREHLSSDLELKVTLYETDRNFVEYPV